MIPGPGESLETTDYHCAGEPFRILDVGPMEGVTVGDRREWAMANLDDLRRFLVNEPRGHADMYGGFVVPPDDLDGDLGIVFFHKDGFSTACGHGTIAIVTWAIDTGLITADGDTVDVVVDVPSGRLPTVAGLDGGRVSSVRFQNVPSYVSTMALDVQTSIGRLPVDVSFGGAFYASVGLDGTDLSADRASLDQLISVGRQVRTALDGSPTVVHTPDDRLSGLYGTIFHETIGDSPLHQRNVTIFADGQVDRSPCGSGTSARLALIHQAGHLKVGDPFLNEGIAGGVFEGRITAATEAGVVTTIEGSAHMHAISSFSLDPHDPIGLGFQLR
ncbi:MAG: proline racemase family protein [Acidimicrobiales bacterium]|jgi:proline racemase|nr:proline racemase family protein [Acidimicrobiales bacterium]MDP6213357.1 proline racemase family protein [Acidimicrobiales bacterium]|tara:strand:+ start:2724 stop:3716 length:993 start_codon:yes stop_codon:yes gene_type:complete